MNDKTDLIEYLLRLGDSALIQGQRLCQWCGKAPALALAEDKLLSG